MKDLVSVIIPNHNYGRCLGQCINSALTQTYNKIEVFVIDNGSSDEPRDLLEQFRGDVHVILQEDLGQAAARNMGIVSSRGNTLAFLDADDYWENEKIERQMELLENDTQLVYTSIRRFNENNSHTTIDSGKFRGNCSKLYLSNPGVSVVLNGESSAIISRSLIRKIGLFNQELNSSSGWDFFRRAMNLSLINFIDAPLTNCRVHTHNMSNNYVKNAEDLRKCYQLMPIKNPDLVAVKHYYLRAITKLEYNFFKGFLKKRMICEATKACRNLLSNLVKLLGGLPRRD